MMGFQTDWENSDMKDTKSGHGGTMALEVSCSICKGAKLKSINSWKGVGIEAPRVGSGGKQWPTVGDPRR